MSDLSYSASNAAIQAKAYVASLLGALGARDPLEVLESTPLVLSVVVAGLTQAQDAVPEGPAKWSVRQVVQHLADSELVGGFRFRMVLAHDSPVIPGYDQDRWAERLHYQEANLQVALLEFTSLRRSNVRLLRRATPGELLRVMRHAERGDESLTQLLPMFAGHDLVHLAQIRRIRDTLGTPSPAV